MTGGEATTPLEPSGENASSAESGGQPEGTSILRLLHARSEAAPRCCSASIASPKTSGASSIVCLLIDRVRAPRQIEPRCYACCSRERGRCLIHRYGQGLVLALLKAAPRRYVSLALPRLVTAAAAADGVGGASLYGNWETHNTWNKAREYAVLQRWYE